jgi:hypothetical protein
MNGQAAAQISDAVDPGWDHHSTRWDHLSTERADLSMPRLLAALLTVTAAAVLAVGAAVGIVALLNATPEQPNTPLVTYETAGRDR